MIEGYRRGEQENSHGPLLCTLCTDPLLSAALIFHTGPTHPIHESFVRSFGKPSAQSTIRYTI